MLATIVSGTGAAGGPRPSDGVVVVVDGGSRMVVVAVVAEVGLAAMRWLGSGSAGAAAVY